MTDSSRPERDIAERVLTCEEARHAAPVDLALVGEEVLRHLRERLSLWFGDDGVRSLTARAISRAAEHFPVLAAVRPAPLDGRQLDRLTDRQQPVDAMRIREALVELFGTQFALLIRLLGADLVNRLVMQIWPEAVPRNEETTETRTEHRE